MSKMSITVRLCCLIRILGPNILKNEKHICVYETVTNVKDELHAVCNFMMKHMNARCPLLLF